MSTAQIVFEFGARCQIPENSQKCGNAKRERKWIQLNISVECGKHFHPLIPLSHPEKKCYLVFGSYHCDIIFSLKIMRCDIILNRKFLVKIMIHWARNKFVNHKTFLFLTSPTLLLTLTITKFKWITVRKYWVLEQNHWQCIFLEVNVSVYWIVWAEIDHQIRKEVKFFPDDKKLSFQLRGWLYVFIAEYKFGEVIGARFNPQVSICAFVGFFFFSILGEIKKYIIQLKMSY